jgi:hypothetical protein
MVVHPSQYTRVKVNVLCAERENTRTHNFRGKPTRRPTKGKGEKYCKKRSVLPFALPSLCPFCIGSGNMEEDQFTIRTKGEGLWG